MLQHEPELRYLKKDIELLKKQIEDDKKEGKDTANLENWLKSWSGYLIKHSPNALQSKSGHVKGKSNNKILTKRKTRSDKGKKRGKYGTHNQKSK